MKYPIHNKLAYYLIACADKLLSLFKKRAPVYAPKKILLCNTAHAGDVVLTTSLLPVLHRAFPGAEVSMLVGSWARELIEGHPLVQHIHEIDHWKVNRCKQSLLKKVWRYRLMRKQALKEINNAHYDLAIDCGLHFPNMAVLLRMAHIPMRMGFVSAGLSPLLTHAEPWDSAQNRSVTEAYFSLLKPFKIARGTDLLRPCLHVPPRSISEDYLVIHMGTGDPRKQWPESKWRALVERLAGEHILFTGAGEGEHEAIERVRKGLENTVNTCNQLSWRGLAEVIQKGTLFIGVDTAAAHVAAAVKTPSVLIYTAIHPRQVWTAQGDNQIILSSPVPCSPCFRGCQAMHCVRDVSVDEVYQAVRSMRPRPTRPA